MGALAFSDSPELRQRFCTCQFFYEKLGTCHKRVYIN